MQKFYLTLKAADYNNGRYHISLAETPIERPSRCTIESFSVTTPRDSEFLQVTSDVLNSNMRSRSGQTNGVIGECMYVLYPDLRIPRPISTTTTTNNVSVGAASTLRMSYVMYNAAGTAVLTVNNCRPISQNRRQSSTWEDSTDSTATGWSSSVDGGVFWFQTGDQDKSQQGDYGLFIDTPKCYSTVRYNSSTSYNMFDNNISVYLTQQTTQLATVYNAANFTGFDMDNDTIGPANTDDVNGIKIPKNNFPSDLTISNGYGYYIKITYNQANSVTTTTTANQYQLISRKPQSYEMRTHSSVIPELDFGFSDEQGVVNPVSGHVELTFS